MSSERPGSANWLLTAAQHAGAGMWCMDCKYATRTASVLTGEESGREHGISGTEVITMSRYHTSYVDGEF